MSKAERTRAFIIEASAPIINKKGMAGTSLTDIMEATKLAKGGIYGNFESKEEICVESYFYLTRNLADKLNTAVSKGGTAREKLFNLLDAYQENACNFGGCPILNFGTEADDTHPQMKALIKKSIESAQNRFFTIVSDGISNGEIAQKIDANVFSVKLFAMIEGAVLCTKVLENDQQMKIVVKAIKEEFETYLT